MRPSPAVAAGKSESGRRLEVKRKKTIIFFLERAAGAFDKKVPGRLQESERETN